jgi:hypothetical protein
VSSAESAWAEVEVDESESVKSEGASKSSDSDGSRIGGRLARKAVAEGEGEATQRTGKGRSFKNHGRRVNRARLMVEQENRRLTLRSRQR